MNIFKKYFEKKKEIEQPEPVNKKTFSSTLQKLTEEAKDKEENVLREIAIKEAFEVYNDIVLGMLEAAAKGESKYLYAIKDQSRDKHYLQILRSEFKTWASLKDIIMVCGHVFVDRGSSDIGIAFYWDKKNNYRDREW